MPIQNFVKPSHSLNATSQLNHNWWENPKGGNLTVKSLGDRMKENYEDRARFKLVRRMPVIIRLDGKAFHTLTRQCEKPFDERLADCMGKVAVDLCREIQGAKCAYTQSDEISVLVTDYDQLSSEAWFDYNLQKIVSISAGIASSHFTRYWCENDRIAVFDSRAFNIPREETTNYFVWRQKDWIRNSVQMLAQANFSPKQLLHKRQTDMLEMLSEKGIDWEKLALRWKNGRFVVRGEQGTWYLDDAPIFTEDRYCIEKYVEQKEGSK